MVAIVSPAPPKGPREPRLEGTAERAGHGHCPDLEGQWGGRSGGGQGGRWGWTWEKLPTRPAQGVPEASLAGQDAVVVTWEGWALGLPPTCSSAPPRCVPCSRSAHLSPPGLSTLRSAHLGGCGTEPSCPAGMAKRRGLARLRYFSLPRKVCRCLESLLPCDWSCS